MFSVVMRSPLCTAKAIPRASCWILPRTSMPHSFRRGVKTSTVDWKPIKTGTTDLVKKEHQAKTKNIRYFFLSLMIAMPVVSFYLGCWQVKRLDWKTKLITRCEHSLSLPPMEDFPVDIDEETAKLLEYRKIKLRGHFDYDQEMFLGPRKRGDDLGYLVICPFHRVEGGKPLLIERGWISKEKIIPENRAGGYLLHLAAPKGEIDIVAMVRVMPKRSYLQYEHDKGSRQFYVPDVPAMAEQSGSLPVYLQAIADFSDHPEWKENRSDSKPVAEQAKKAGWFFKSASKEQQQDKDDDDSNFIARKHNSDLTLDHGAFEFVNEGVPIATVPKVTFKNNHIHYLVTWFALSFFSTGLLIYSLAKGRGGALAEKVIAAKRKHMKTLE